MKASNAAIDLIKRYEGCELEAYLDSHGKWAVGYGQTGKHITPGLRILQSEADQWLKNHVAQLQDDITELVSVPLTQQQFDALVSLVYNIGIGAFARSTLLKKLNQQHYDEAASQLLRWDHSQGVQLPGLANRRAAEYRLFNS